jgi:hypothetical protein
MLRVAVLLLLLANLLFFAFSHGWLADVTGLRPHAEREPERLKRQVNADKVVVLPAAAASAASAVRSSEPAASAPQRSACLEAGPFATGALVSATAALQALQPPLPAGSWVDVTVERPGRWMVYMGRYPNREALAKKEEELRRTRVSFEEVAEPAEWTMGLSLGRYDDRAAAERALEQASQRGVRSAKVVELAAPTTLHLLRAENADAALAERLSALRSPALGRGFVACGS